MDYLVTTGLRPPVEAAKLDLLQQEGVGALLDQQLGQVEGVAGPSDEDIDVLDYRIEVRADGATVLLAVDAPTLPTAESAAANVLREVLAEADALGGWTLTSSEVEITEDEFNERLAAADRAADPALSEAEQHLQAEIEDALEGADDSERSQTPEPNRDPEHWRARLTELAERFRALPAESFTPVDRPDPPNATLAAGALVHAAGVVIDELFYDELALTVNDATAGQAVGLLVLDELPPCYQHYYDARFSRALLVCATMVASRLTASTWRTPRNVGESLALRLFVNEARVVLEATELMDWTESGPYFESFMARAVSDPSVEELFDAELPVFGAEQSDVSSEQVNAVADRLRDRGLAFDHWFTAGDDVDGAQGPHPYLGGPRQSE